MNISFMINLDGKTVVSQLQNFIILQMKVDVLYLKLVKMCTQKILILGNVFSLNFYQFWLRLFFSF